MLGEIDEKGESHLSNLTGLYESIADKAILKFNLEIGNSTLADLIQAKEEFDINEILVGIDLKSGSECQVDYEKGVGIRNNEGLEALLELLDVFEIITGKDESYRYMRTDTTNDLVRVKCQLFEDSDGYTDEFFDFNTLELANWEEIYDYDALDDFFESAKFLPAPGLEKEEPPHKYLWDDFDAVKKELKKAKEAGEKIYIYTLIEENNAAYIFEGYSFVNRLGYFLSNKPADYKEPIRYW